MGSLGYDVPRDDPNFSKLVPCPAPGCLEESWKAYKAGAEYLQRKGVARPQQTFDTFQKYPGTEAAYDAVYAWATGKSDFILLLLYGGKGNGKTHLASAATIYQNNHGQDCRYFVVSELMSSLKGAMAQGENVEEQIAALREYQALIFDDYKPELGTPFEQDVMEQVINHRYAYLYPTVLITNADVKPDTFPERILDRFLEPKVGKVVVNDGESQRTK